MCLLALTFPVFHSSRFLVRRRYKYSMPSLVPKGCKVLEVGGLAGDLVRYQLHWYHTVDGRNPAPPWMVETL